ncbi:Zinc knuckle [Popillia japonica]|uniref:Zinc knuckle n=1 Tax=Popillia japonica TaxID=7064 RepID=A0AAW1K1R4_POPJA
MLLQQNATLMELIKQREPHRNNVNFSIIPDINSCFIDFDGEKGPSDARHWLKKIDSSALLHNWSETITFEAARSHLKGAAAAWYKEKDIDSWQEFKPFRCRSPEETKDQLIVGLYSKDFCDFLLSKSHLDADHLYHDTLRFERIHNDRIERITKSKAQTYVKKPEQAYPKNTVASNTETGLGGHRKIENSKQCFRCKQVGHYSINCPGKPKIICYNCNGEGHISKNCTKPKRQGYSIVKEEVRTIGSTNSDIAVQKYHKEIEINNNKHTAIIDQGSSDQGSSVCTIKATVALMHDYKILKDVTKLIGFGDKNNYVNAPGYIEVAIKIDDHH